LEIDPDAVAFATINLTDPEKGVSIEAGDCCKEALAVDLEHGGKGGSVFIEHVHYEFQYLKGEAGPSWRRRRTW
jgi:hypothetical protein